MSLKERVISGVFWSSFGVFLLMTLEFGVGIVLARLLSPYEFGLIGMINVFIAISDIFINSGMLQALVQKKICEDSDYSTAFFYNFGLGLIFYFTLFFSASPICTFYNEPQLLWVIRILGLVVLVASLSLVQKASLTRRLDFKILSKISIISSLSSGIISVLMAVYGYGVWSLAIKTLSSNIITTGLLWYYNKWIPKLIFSSKSFSHLFNFGSKLLVSGIIGVVYGNLYNVILGKYYTTGDVGYYTRADLFKNLPSKNIEGIITSVSFPVLSQIHQDKSQLSNVFRSIIRNLSFVVFLSMSCLGAVSEALILFLLGDKWAPVIPMLQILSIAGMFQPLISVHLNTLNSLGRPEMYLKFQILFLIITIPTLFLGIFYSINIMIVGLVVVSFINLIIVGSITGKHTGYRLFEQSKDILPLFFLSLLIGMLTYVLGSFISASPSFILTFQILFFIFISIIINEMIKLHEYEFLKNLITDKIKICRKNYE